MSWTNSAVVSTEPAERIVSLSVQARRWQGLQTAHAIDDVATALHTTPRRIRSLFKREIYRITMREYRRLLDLWWVDMDRQAAELHALADRISEGADRHWSSMNQLSLPLGDVCTGSLPRSSSSLLGTF